MSPPAAREEAQGHGKGRPALPQAPGPQRPFARLGRDPARTRRAAAVSPAPRTSLPLSLSARLRRDHAAARQGRGAREGGRQSER